MGYIHDTHTSQFVPPAQIEKSAGTWTPTLSTDDYYHRRTAADANFNLFVPVRMLSNSSARKGGYLKSIELIYNVTTAALDGVATVALKRLSFSAAGASTAADVAISASEDATARKAVGTHRVVVTLSSPVWVDASDAYVLYVACDGSSGGIFDLYGAIVNYTVRL